MYIYIKEYNYLSLYYFHSYFSKFLGHASLELTY